MALAVAVSVGGGGTTIQLPVFTKPITLPISLPPGDGLSVSVSLAPLQIDLSGSLDGHSFNLPLGLGLGADTISPGSGADTAVTPGQASVAGASGAADSVGALLGHSTMIGSSSLSHVMSAGGATTAAESVAGLHAPQLFNFGSESTVGSNLASGFLHNSELAQLASPAPDHSTDTTGAHAHPVMSLDGGLTTIDLKGGTHHS